MFAVVFGLSMDYEVFLVSRIREEWVRYRDATRAVTDGIAFTGRVITAAAAIMICVFLSFMLGDQRAIKEFGFGLAVAVFLDALVVRCVLLPAVLELLGPVDLVAAAVARQAAAADPDRGTGGERRCRGRGGPPARRPSRPDPSLESPPSNQPYTLTVAPSAMQAAGARRRTTLLTRPLLRAGRRVRTVSARDCVAKGPAPQADFHRGWPGVRRVRARVRGRARGRARGGARGPRRSRRRTAATKTVRYRGYAMRVPASWPVFHLSRRSTVCVRFNRHAVYLGAPGARQACPATPPAGPRRSSPRRARTRPRRSAGAGHRRRRRSPPAGPRPSSRYRPIGSR